MIVITVARQPLNSTRLFIFIIFVSTSTRKEINFDFNLYENYIPVNLTWAVCGMLLKVFAYNMCIAKKLII